MPSKDIIQNMLFVLIHSLALRGHPIPSWISDCGGLSCHVLGSGLSKSPLASCDASSPLACDASPLACDAWVRVLHLSLADACSLIMATEKLTGWPVYIDIFHGHTHPPRCNIHRAVVEISQGFHCTFHV